MQNLSQKLITKHFFSFLVFVFLNWPYRNMSLNARGYKLWSNVLGLNVSGLSQHPSPCPVCSSQNTLWVKSCKLRVTIVRADVASVCYWFPFLFLFCFSLFTVTHKAPSGWLHLTALQYTHTAASQSHGHKNISSHSSSCHAAHISITQRGKEYCFSFYRWQFS